MRIITQGTSHGNHTYNRFNSSTLVEVEDVSYLIDAGAPANGLMIRANKEFHKLQAVFITHMHEDHTGGLPGVIKTLLKKPQDDQHTMVLLPEENAISPLEGWLKAMHLKWPSSIVSLRPFREGLIFEDDNITMKAVGNNHIRSANKQISFSFILDRFRKRVVFTGDLSHDFSDFPLIARRETSDICVCEMTHFSPETALPILKECPIKHLIFNHIHDPWHGKGEATLKEIFQSLPYPYTIAHDGDVFEI